MWTSVTEDLRRRAMDCITDLAVKFTLVSLLLATRSKGVTIDSHGTTDWQPSSTSIRQTQRGLSPETISIMRPPPPPHGQVQRLHSRPPSPSLTPHNRHTINQRPSVHPEEVSPSQFQTFQEDVRNVRSNFAQLSHGYSTQSNSPEKKIVDSSRNRKPLQFSGLSDSSISESIVSEHVVPFPDQQQFIFPNRVFQQDNKQQLVGANTENPPVLLQNRFVQNTIPSRSNWNQNGGEYVKRPLVEDNLGSQHTGSLLSPQSFPPADHKPVLAPFSNASNYFSVEPLVQFAQSIEASEHHSTYHAPSTSFQPDQIPSAIRVTKAPDFGPATRSFSENKLRTTSAPDIKKKITLKDILVEDCPKAKEIGYCASPPRYPSHQISQLIARCADLLPSLYAPVPEDADDEDETTTRSFNSTSNMERGNRHVWSWARPGESQQTVCDSERLRIEPGYVLESPSGRWYVVLQASSLTQRVTLDKCRNVGKPCAATKCARNSGGFRNNAAKGSRCVQRHSYSHLVTWDPDKPDLCPRIRVFRFPTACVCYLTSS